MMLKFENLAKEFTDTNSSAVTSFIVNILRATFYWLRAFRRTPFLVSSCFYLHNHSTDFTCFGKSWQNKFQFIVLEGRGYGQENFSELSTQITYIYIYRIKVTLKNRTNKKQKTAVFFSFCTLPTSPSFLDEFYVQIL